MASSIHIIKEEVHISLVTIDIMMKKIIKVTVTAAVLLVIVIPDMIKKMIKKMYVVFLYLILKIFIFKHS